MAPISLARALQLRRAPIAGWLIQSVARGRFASAMGFVRAGNVGLKNRLGGVMRIAKNLFAAIAGVAAIMAAAWASADAKFNVMGASWSADGSKLDVKLAWKLNSYNTDKNGVVVKFVVHDTMPAYRDGANGKPTGQTVKMKEGTGMATVSLDAKALGLTPGKNPTLVGLWPSGHKWGMDDGGRKGGKFTVPSLSARQKPKAPAKPKAKGAAAHKGTSVKGTAAQATGVQASATHAAAVGATAVRSTAVKGHAVKGARSGAVVQRQPAPPRPRLARRVSQNP